MDKQKNNIEEKVIVITGAISGMGEAAAKHLSAFGATVVLGTRRTDRIEKLAKEIQDNGGQALAIAVDVTQRDQVKKLVDSAVFFFIGPETAGVQHDDVIGMGLARIQAYSSYT